jgi:N-methylhydantoinase A
VAVEAITWRVVSSGPRPDLRLSTAPEATGDAESARKGTRRAYVPESGGMTEVPVYDRYRLGPEAKFSGAAIVEERESTTVIGPEAAVSVDGEGNLVVEVQEPHAH